MIPIVVLASGRGSNFEALYQAISTQKVQGVEIRAVFSDQPQAPVLARARALGIETRVIPFQKAELGPGGALLTEKRTAHARLLLAALAEFEPRFLVLAGYMRILAPELLNAYRDPRGYCRIVNIHPSLLPSFPGIHSYAQAYEYGVQVTGVTVHLVEEGVDTGPICAQQAFSIEGCRSVEEVEKLGLALEHRLFPETLSWVLQEKFQIEKLPQGRLCVRKN